MDEKDLPIEESAFEARYKLERETEERRFVRFPLIIALIGLMLSPIYGIGGIFSVFSLASGISRSKKRKSNSLKWAIIISAITIALCFFYALAVSTALVYRAYELTQIETTALG